MKKHMISAMLALSLVFGIPLAASAHPVPDMTRKGSVTVSMTYQNKPVSGGTLALYKVGEVHEDDGNFSFVPVREIKSLISEYKDIQSPELAGTLSKYAEQKKITALKTVTVGEDGKAVFSNLDLGLYMVIQTAAASGYKKTSPFLVSVPYLDKGEYVYDVKSTPKNDLKRETEKTPKPTEPPSQPSGGGRKLPQSGQLWWPVPMLTCAGLGSIAVGLIRRRESEDEG